jgi:hypothetical protein
MESRASIPCTISLDTFFGAVPYTSPTSLATDSEDNLLLLLLSYSANLRLTEQSRQGRRLGNENEPDFNSIFPMTLLLIPPCCLTIDRPSGQC